jgi:hypothetical protein
LSEMTTVATTPPAASTIVTALAAATHAQARELPWRDARAHRATSSTPTPEGTRTPIAANRRRADRGNFDDPRAATVFVNSDAPPATTRLSTHDGAYGSVAAAMGPASDASNPRQQRPQSGPSMYMPRSV